MTEQNQSKKLHTLQGRVVSDKMQQTITVLVERRVRHDLYGKYVTRSTRLKAHDSQGVAKLGDMVSICPCSPVSKGKSWRLVDVITTATPVGA